MNVDEMTIGQIKQIQAMFFAQKEQAHPFAIGKNYFLRTVTHHYTGTLVAVYPQELVLQNAAWIADDGRFMQAVANGTFQEVEPYPDDALVIIGRGSLLDMVEITNPIPRSQK